MDDLHLAPAPLVGLLSYLVRTLIVRDHLGLLLVGGVAGCALQGSAVDAPALEKSEDSHSRLIATELSKENSNTKPPLGNPRPAARRT